jgi:hypothetical protein
MYSIRSAISVTSRFVAVYVARMASYPNPTFSDMQLPEGTGRISLYAAITRVWYENEILNVNLSLPSPRNLLITDESVVRKVLTQLSESVSLLQIY